ncbi:MAG: DUF4179 domain-containing protein [Oscillospiraceae bacterium]|nr:DUF4179 domain-containing protein [Oscillospiraceae bacterium]
MNREQEYHALKHEHISTPLALENVLADAQARAKRRNFRNYTIMPLSTIALLFAFFVGLVNLSPAVATAVERIPGLQQLAAIVSFSPSLTEAVEQDFVQTVGLEQQIGDVTMRVEYVVVDGQHIHIFYTLESAIYSNLSISVGAWDAENRYTSATLMLSPRREENDNMRYMMFGFDDRLPNVVIWAGKVLNMDSDYVWGNVIGEYEFILELDAEFVQAGEIIALDYDFALDGQYLTLTTIELNPAHTRINFTADDANTKLLRALWFYMENEHGERFYPPHEKGIVANPSTGLDTIAVETHFLESVFFAESESLIMVIEEVIWLDKSMEYVRINLADGTSEPLPDGMQLESVEQLENGWILIFSTFEQGEYQMHRITYTMYPESWNDLEFRGILDNWYIHETTPGLFFSTQYPPVDNTFVALTPQFSRIVRLETPIVVQVR